MNKLTAFAAPVALLLAVAAADAQAVSRRPGSLATGGRVVVPRTQHATASRHHGRAWFRTSHRPRIIRRHPVRHAHGGRVYFSIGTPGFTLYYGGSRHLGLYRYRRPFYRRYVFPRYRFHTWRPYRYRSDRSCR